MTRLSLCFWCENSLQEFKLRFVFLRLRCPLERPCLRRKNTISVAWLTYAKTRVVVSPFCYPRTGSGRPLYFFHRKRLGSLRYCDGAWSRAIVTPGYVRGSLGVHRGRNHLNRPGGCDAPRTRRVSPRILSPDRRKDDFTGRTIVPRRSKRAITMLIGWWRVYRSHCAARVILCT